MYRLAALASLALALSPSPATAQSADRIGITAAATNQVVGTLGNQQRSLRVGDGVSQNEQIRTGAASTAQLLFRDETSLSLGPESIVVLDRAVYDPSKRAGEVTVRAVSGAFRFVSGSSPADNYKITTAAGTIGIRGTVIDVEIFRQIILAIVRQGSAEYCPRPGNCIVVQAGQFFVIAGGIASAPRPINDHACGMTGLSGGQSGCVGKILANLLHLDPQALVRNLGTDFHPGTFAGGAPPGLGSGGPGGPGGPGGCAVLLPNGNCYPGVGSPGKGTPPPGLRP
jgi:hypothetical protein